MDDVGVVINPQIVEGQVHGGIAQGIAQALWEEAQYDEDGNLLQSSMLNYLVPSAAELPSFEIDRTETDSLEPARRQGGGGDRDDLRPRGRHERGGRRDVRLSA